MIVLHVSPFGGFDREVPPPSFPAPPPENPHPFPLPPSPSLASPPLPLTPAAPPSIHTYYFSSEVYERILGLAGRWRSASASTCWSTASSLSVRPPPHPPTPPFLHKSAQMSGRGFQSLLVSVSLHGPGPTVPSPPPFLHVGGYV